MRGSDRPPSGCFAGPAQITLLRKTGWLWWQSGANSSPDCQDTLLSGYLQGILQPRGEAEPVQNPTGIGFERVEG